MSLGLFTAVKPATCRWGHLPLYGSQQHVVGAVYRCEASNMSLGPFTVVREPATCRWGRLPLWSQQHVVGAIYRCTGASNMSLGPFTAVKPATCRWGHLPLYGSQHHVVGAFYRCTGASNFNVSLRPFKAVKPATPIPWPATRRGEARCPGTSYGTLNSLVIFSHGTYYTALRNHAYPYY